jgi:hypothetical protein
MRLRDAILACRHLAGNTQSTREVPVAYLKQSVVAAAHEPATRPDESRQQTAATRCGTFTHIAVPAGTPV